MLAGPGGVLTVLIDASSADCNRPATMKNKQRDERGGKGSERRIEQDSLQAFILNGTIKCRNLTIHHKERIQQNKISLVLTGQEAPYCHHAEPNSLRSYDVLFPCRRPTDSQPAAASGRHVHSMSNSSRNGKGWKLTILIMKQHGRTGTTRRAHSRRAHGTKHKA